MVAALEGKQEAAGKAQLKPQSSCQQWLKKSKSLPVSNKSGGHHAGWSTGFFFFFLLRQVECEMAGVALKHPDFLLVLAA